MKTLSQFVNESSEIDEIDAIDESKYAAYENTPENAKRIGWNRVPEYCNGDKNSKFVVHNHHKGTFTYTNKLEESVEISESADVELKPHPNGTHYIVHKIHAKSGIDSDQLKVGEKLSDTHVDDLNDMGYKVKIHKA